MEGSAEGDRSVEMISGDSSGGMYDISGLSAATRYTVDVAAVNSAGIGVYSHPMTTLTSGTCIYTSMLMYTTDIFFHLQLSHQWYL